MDATDFMAEYVKYTGNNSEAPVIAAATKLLSDPAVATFLALPDSIATADGQLNMQSENAQLKMHTSISTGSPIHTHPPTHPPGFVLQPTTHPCVEAVGDDTCSLLRVPLALALAIAIALALPLARSLVDVLAWHSLL